MPELRNPEDAPRSRPEEGRRPTSRPPDRPSRADAIRAVSDLLSRKKPVLDGPSAPAPLPRFPRPLDATLALLEKGPSLRAKFDMPRTSLGPPPVTLPDGGPPGRPGGGEPDPGEIPGARPEPAVDSRLVPPVGARAPLAEGVGLRPASPPLVGMAPVAAVPPASGEVPGYRLPPPTSSTGQGNGPPAPPANPQALAPPETARIFDPATDRGAVRVRGTVRFQGTPAPAETAGVVAVDPPRDLGFPPGPGSLGPFGAEVIRAGVPHSRSSDAPGAGSPSAPGIEAPSGAVRNPLSSGLRNLSLAGPDFPGGGGGTTPGLDSSGIGSGPGDRASDGPTTSRGGASADLSKTNELLRQLVDAVKRQRDASLPVGGPPVYPDR